MSILLGRTWSGSAFADYEVIEVSAGGTIKGAAIWKGDIPAVPPLKVFADMDVCGETAESPVLQIDPQTKGLRFVLIYLEKAEKGKAPEAKYSLHMGKQKAVRTSRTCLFQEHVFPFVRTSQIGITNFDEVLHNPHFFHEKRSSLLNIAMPSPDREVITQLPRAQGVGVRFQCDVHVHMNGWMAAFPHPYFAVTDSEGRFELTNVPPGTYTLIAWHEGYDIVSFVSSRPTYDEPHVIRKSIEVKPHAVLEEQFHFPVRNVEVQWKVAGSD
ncbi:MAG TPA: carboxypeptidase-like regulatory domain-containing protein [Nitrospiraceae bacterium]|nr:carboxypeptidase-like regulatory domain-containing protein [Nitrospiraceae bacterium]